MNVAEDLRAEASDIRRIAGSRLDWTTNMEVKKRYANDPGALESIRNSAENALRGAARLEHYATVMESRAAKEKAA